MPEEPWKLMKKINSDPQFFILFNQNSDPELVVQLSKKFKSDPKLKWSNLKVALISRLRVEQQILH